MSSIRISPKSTGRSDQFGYYVYYDHRQREGFRENSDYHLNAGSAKLVYDVSSDSRFILTIDAYNEDHGEPGGLTAIPAPGAALYQVDRNVTTRFFDRFRLQRYYGVLEYQKIFLSTQSSISKPSVATFRVIAIGSAAAALAWRQIRIPEPGSAASTDDIQDRQDYTEGVDARMRHDYPLGNDFRPSLAECKFYHALQDRSDDRGLTPDAEEGVPRRFNTGVTWNGSIFAENRFVLGVFRWSRERALNSYSKAWLRPSIPPSLLMSCFRNRTFRPCHCLPWVWTTL